MAYAKGGAGSGKKKDEEQQDTPQQAAQQAAAKYQADGQKKTTSARNSTAAGSFTKAGSEPQQSSKASPAQPKKSYWSPSEVSSDTSAHAAAAKDRAAQSKPGSTWNPDTINTGKQSQPSPFQGSKTKAEGTANDRWQMEQSLKAQQNDDDVRIASMINGAARGDSNYRKQLAGTEYEKWIGDLERAHKEGQAVKAVVKDGKVSFESDAGEGRYYFGMDRNGNKVKTQIQSEIDANREEVSAWFDTVTDYINGGKFSNEETAKIMGAGKRYKQAVEAGLLDDDTWADSNGSKYTTTEAIDLLTDSMWNAIDRDNGEKRYQAYMSSGDTNSQTTRDLYDQAVAARDAATSEKEIKYWDERVKALDAQLKEDEKAEKRANNPVLKAWDSLTGSFERPERANAEDVTTPERDELVRQYQEAVAQDQQAAGYVTDPNDPEYAKIKENRDALKNQLMEMNRSLGLGLYEGLADEDRASDMAQGWLGGRAAGVTADAGALLGGVDDYFSGFIDDTHRDLVMRQAAAAQKAAGPMGTQADWEEADRLQAEVDQYEREHRDENRTALTDASDTLLNAAQGWKTEADRQWDNALADLSEGERYAANVGRGVLDLFLDVGENAVAPGVGTARMYMAAGGDRALEQMGRENNTQEAVATAAMLGSASAWLSEKLFGRTEAAYGKSVFGQLSDKLISRLPGGAQRIVKAATNSEPIEEGLENFLNYLGDRVLSLDPEAQMDWVQTRQESAIAYGTGLIFNLLLGDVPIDAKKMQAIADESMEAADVIANGGTKEDIKQTALETTKDMVVMDLKKAEEQAASQNAAIEGQNQNVAPAPAQTSQDIAQSQNAALEGQNQSVSAAPTQTSQDIAQSQNAALEGQDQEVQQVRTRRETAPQAETPAQETVIDILMNPNGEGGKLSNSQVKTITSDEALTQAFEEVTGQTIEGVTNSEIRNSAKDSAFDWLFEPAAEAETQSQENAVQEQETAPAMEEQAPLAERMESGQVTEDEYMELLQSEEGRQELADALGIPNSDTQSVVDGLSLYLILQNQINNQQNAETQAETTEATETPTEAQEASEGINTQEEQGNAPEGELNTQEANETSNPIPNTETEVSGNRNVNTNRNTQQNRREKISQYFTNTLTESGRAEGLDPITYNPTSEAESLTNAAMRLSNDMLGTLEDLMYSPAWNGELVDAAWMIENEFMKAATESKDRTALDAWKRLETHKISETAKGLQAVAKQSRPGAAGVLNAIMNEIDSIRESNQKARKAGRPQDVVSEEILSAAEQKANEIAFRMAELENQIDNMVESGMSEADAKNSVREAYLDMIDDINTFRHTGLFQDAKQQAGARADAKANRQVRKLNTKFRKMLSGESMDYIMRFAACDAAGISEDLHYDGKQDFTKRLNTWQKLAQLTGTGTWLRNGVGNGSFGIIDVLSADNPATLIADALLSRSTGVRSSGVEFGLLNAEARQAAARALNRSILEVAANIDLAADPDMSKYDMKTIRSYDPDGKALERIVSRWEQWNGYMLQSSDAWFKGMAEGSAESAIRKANKWGEDNLTNDERARMSPEDAQRLSRQRQNDLDETKKQIAEYRTFQNNGVTATAANDVRDWVNKLGRKAKNSIFGGEEWQQGQFGLGTALMPYTKVPTNLAVKSLEFSPAGAVKGLAEMIRVATDPNATMAQQNQAVTDFGRGVTGTGLIAIMAMLMKQAPFFKDWDAEDDKDVKSQNRSEGKYGMEFNTSMIGRFLQGDKNPTWQNGDRTIDISSMEPFNQLVTISSLIAEGMPKGQAFYTAARDSVLGMPALQTISNIENSIKYTDTPDEGLKTLANTAASTAGSVVGGMNPAPIRHLATVTDDKVRDTSGNSAIERAWNQILGGIPEARETLPVKTDSFGNEMSSGDTATRIANQYDAFKHTQVNQGDVSRELERLRTETDQTLMPSRNGPSSEQFGSGENKEKVKLTAEERKEWKDDYGQEFESDVGILMRSQVYRNADDSMKAELIQNLTGYVKDDVKGDFAEEHDLPYESKYEEIRELDNPISFLSTSKAFNIAESNDTWDVVDELIGPVQNLTKPEKDLMREKNATLMNYFDFLTPNDMGYKVKDAGTVRAYKTGAKASAEARNKTSPSGQDKFNALYNGYGDGTFTDQDIDAIMSKAKTKEDEETGEETTTWEVTKGRAAIYLAARAGGASVKDALQITKDADVDNDGTIDEKGVKIKAEYEGTNALKNSGISDKNSMWYQFNDIMYPWKNK